MEDKLKLQFDKKKAFGLLKAFAEAIRDLGSVPSGHLYARVMSKMPLEDYQQVIGSLIKMDLVREDNYLLTWIGDK